MADSTETAEMLREDVKNVRNNYVDVEMNQVPSFSSISIVFSSHLSFHLLLVLAFLSSSSSSSSSSHSPPFLLFSTLISS